MITPSKPGLLYPDPCHIFNARRPGGFSARAIVIGLVLLTAPQANGFVGELEAMATPLSSVYLRWQDTTTGESGFLIERKTGEELFTEVATAPPDSIAFTDTGLLPGTDYLYKVTAIAGVALPGSTVAVTTLPEWAIPEAQSTIEVTAPGTFEFGFSGQGASYTVEESNDLDTWSDTGSPAFLDAFNEFSMLVESSALPRFFRVQSHTYERLPIIGLSMPFEIPPEPSGEIWDVTLFGASPANINDSNDDAVAIKVVLSIAEPGDVILIPAGSYTIRQTLEIPTGVTLRGAGMDDTTLVTEALARAIVVPPEAHDIRIEGFTITYLGETEEFETGVYVGSSRQGLNSYRILIDGIRVERFSVHGVSLRDSHHVLVQNCEMMNATNIGGGGHGYGIALNYPTNNNNWIRNNTIGPVIRHAVLLQYYAHNNLVEHNLAFENTEDAYDLHGEDEYANELRYNIARNGDRDGFGVGNTGSTHDRSGPHNWIHHNTVENSLYGIEVIQDSDVVYIDKNTFSNNRYGIRIHNLGGNHVYVRGNVVRGNEIGISVFSARWVWLLDNTIEDQTSYGIEVLTEVQDLVDQGNTFSGNALDYRP